MSLFGIGKKLYKKDAPEDLSKHDLSEYDPEASKIGETLENKKGDWVDKTDTVDPTSRKKIEKGLIILGTILAVIFSAVFIYEVRKLVFTRSNVTVSISGPQSVDSGHLVTYEISYANKNLVNLNNAKLKIIYPEDFRPEPDENFQEDGPNSGTYSLEKVGWRSSGKVSFSGRGYNPKGTLIYLEAELSYGVYSFQGSATDRLGVNIVPAPIRLEISGPQKVTSGDAVDYVITYVNTGQERLNNLQVRMEYPDGFNFNMSEPNPIEGDSVWAVGNLNPGQEGKIIIRGNISGSEGRTKRAKVSMGIVMKGSGFKSYNDESVETLVSKAPFFITQTVNESSAFNISAGQHLDFKLEYRNDSNIGLRDVVLVEKLDSPVLDYSSLYLPHGNFDIASKQIVWKASDIPSFRALEPGAGGVVNFSIRVKENIPLDGDKKKNFVVSSLAKIDSPDVPTAISGNKVVSSNEMRMKLNSKMLLETKGYYNDNIIPNSGPIPPRVSQTTTYTIHWTVKNVSNDLNNAKVTAFLPTNATATGKFSPDDARVDYNERTNSITWNIGKIDAGSGILNSPLEMAFQIKITPSIEQKNKEVGILGPSIFSADDLFTGDKLEVRTDIKNINLVEDTALSKLDGGRVSE